LGKVAILNSAESASGLYPRLETIITAHPGLIGTYPSLRYGLYNVLHRSIQDINPLRPPKLKSVTEREKNEQILDASADLARRIAYTSGLNPTEILQSLRKIGEWIDSIALPGQCLYCCDGQLPQTIIVLTDQHEIPWELTWVDEKFLSQHVILARYPFVAKARTKDLAYHDTPKLVVLIGRSNGLFAADAELEVIGKTYKKYFDKEIEVYRGESVTPQLIKKILAEGSTIGGPFDIVHFIGHGNSQLDEVWLELVSTPFLTSHIPPSIEGNPIVFWNACFSASGGLAQYNYQASILDSFGEKLLSNGASHFIGPLFPVLDSTARKLASSFYDHLFSGLPVGQSLFEAKKFAENDPIAHTYVLYGNPALEVVSNAKRSSN
jgi:hypothetical protein